MADVFSKEKRSQIMARIKSKNTIPELHLFALVKELYKKGFRYRKHPKNIFGKPDLVFPRYKVAVFVDSEFWHGRDMNSLRPRLPKDYWVPKIERNIARDIEVNKTLKQGGWKVLRIWSKDIKSSSGRIIKELEALLS